MRMHMEYSVYIVPTEFTILIKGSDKDFIIKVKQVVFNKDFELTSKLRDESGNIYQINGDYTLRNTSVLKKDTYEFDSEKYGNATLTNGVKSKYYPEIKTIINNIFKKNPWVKEFLDDLDIKMKFEDKTINSDTNTEQKDTI